MAKMVISALALALFSTMATAQSLYKIRPGDTLRIEVLEDQTLNREALVLPDGTISVPLVGNVRAVGRSVGDVQSRIASGLAPNFATAPNVYVTIASLAEPREPREPATIDVFAMGEVNTPGKTEISPGTNLLQFLAQVGGFTRFAATKRIQVRRTDPRTGRTAVYGFNYRALEDGSANVNSIILKKGDVIVVPERRLFE